MRIVAGQFGGRKLNVPKGRDIRPTSDKVRGAIFNSLNSYLDIDGCHVLDAFCGTGALGLEALSRGAEACDFFDKAPRSLDLARDNAELLGVDKFCKFKVCDATKVHVNRSFDLVFLDPPYNKALLPTVLSNLKAHNAFKTDCVIVMESETGFYCDMPDGFEQLRAKEYGDTLVTYLRYK